MLLCVWGCSHWIKRFFWWVPPALKSLRSKDIFSCSGKEETHFDWHSDEQVDTSPRSLGAVGILTPPRRKLSKELFFGQFNDGSRLHDYWKMSAASTYVECVTEAKNVTHNQMTNDSTCTWFNERHVRQKNQSSKYWMITNCKRRWHKDMFFNYLKTDTATRKCILNQQLLLYCN